MLSYFYKTSISVVSKLFFQSPTSPLRSFHHSSPLLFDVPHHLPPCFIFLYIQLYCHHTRRRLSLPSLYSMPLETLGMPSPSLRTTSLFLTISCVWRSNLSPLISYFSSPFFFPCSALIALIYFGRSNPLHFAQSYLIFYLRVTIIDPLCLDLLTLLFSAYILFLFFYSTSIGSVCFPCICIIYSTCFVFSLLISECYSSDPLLFICPFFLSWVR